MSSQSVNIDLQRSGNKVGKTVIPSPNDSRRKQETTYVTIETFALKMKFLKKKKSKTQFHYINSTSFHLFQHDHLDIESAFMQVILC